MKKILIFSLLLFISCSSVSTKLTVDDTFNIARTGILEKYNQYIQRKNTTIINGYGIITVYVINEYKQYVVKINSKGEIISIGRIL